MVPLNILELEVLNNKWIIKIIFPRRINILILNGTFNIRNANYYWRNANSLLEELQNISSLLWNSLFCGLPLLILLWFFHLWMLQQHFKNVFLLFPLVFSGISRDPFGSGVEGGETVFVLIQMKILQNEIDKHCIALPRH